MTEDALLNALQHTDGPLVVVTGAGISAASGIPTFRGNDTHAHWKRSPMELATFDFFRQDPVTSWTWYLSRMDVAKAAAPNPGHAALATLEKWWVGQGREFTLVTQNIDTLHERAGSQRLVKVHGSFDRVRCANEECAAPTLPWDESRLTDFRESPSTKTLPRCALCNELLRVHVLWFDESYDSHNDYGWLRARGACQSMALVLFVGTSFSVGVTDMFATFAARAQIPAWSVDISGLAPTGVQPLSSPAEELLPQLISKLR